MTIPIEASDAVALLERIFGNDLVGAYLYGSAVGGGLRTNSDVDLLAVIAKAATQQQRRVLADGLLKTSGRYPPAPGARRPLELGVLARETLVGFRHPIKTEFVYGEWLRPGFEAGDVPEAETNPDYTLILAQVRQQGRVLVGPEPASLLPAISTEDVKRAIRDSLPSLLEHLLGDERNVILTLARMWFTVTTGQFVSKDAAAAWGESCAPREIAETLQFAGNGYKGLLHDNWETRTQEAERAARYMSAQIAGEA